MDLNPRAESGQPRHPGLTWRTRSQQRAVRAGLHSLGEDFTVVEWDQRGAGRTFGRNGAQLTGTLSIDRLTQDGIELTQHLRSRLKKDKVILFALSFGSVIGLKMD